MGWTNYVFRIKLAQPLEIQIAHDRKKIKNCEEESHGRARKERRRRGGSFRSRTKTSHNLKLFTDGSKLVLLFNTILKQKPVIGLQDEQSTNSYS